MTLNDCWSLDLNTRDAWKQILPGTMDRMVWKGEADDSTQGTGGISEEEEEDDLDDGSSPEEDEGDEEESGPARLRQKEVIETKEESKSDKSKDARRKEAGLREKPHKSGSDLRTSSSSTTTKKTSGLRGEMASIREQMGDTEPSPLSSSESLRDFFARTSLFWSEKVQQRWRDQKEGSSSALSEKEIKREAFKLSEERYTALLPLLTKLAELERQTTGPRIS